MPDAYNSYKDLERKQRLHASDGREVPKPYLTRMHLLARMRACSSDSRDRIMNGREVSIFGGNSIVNL